MSTTNVLKVGIASLEQYKARTIAIARGEYVPSPDEPKVWFQSLETLAQVLKPFVASANRRDETGVAQ